MLFLYNRKQKMNEHQTQVAVITWFRMQYPKLIMFAIPNGGVRNIVTAVKLKSEGVLAGVADLFLMKANTKYHGLFIEMKAPKGKVSDQQKYFIEQAKAQGYAACVCFGFDEAQAAINNYLRDV
jgi:hypothetical protein